MRASADNVTDARYEDEVSGCTASAALVTDKQIYVVCALFLHSMLADSNFRDYRPMLVIPGLFSVSRAGLNRFRSTTSPRTKARRLG